MNNQMDNNLITISKNAVKEKGGVVVLPLKKWEEIEKKNLELHSAVEAILSGELALQKQKTRTFGDFLKSEFPKYAKNF